MKVFCVIFLVIISIVWTTSAVDRNEGTRCTSDYQCAGHLTCKNRQCKNPCDYKECASDAYCSSRNHLAICSCKIGFTGNGLVECSKEERCVYNPDCPANRSCRGGKCVDSCATECKNKNKCQVISHYPICDD